MIIGDALAAVSLICSCPAAGHPGVMMIFDINTIPPSELMIHACLRSADGSISGVVTFPVYRPVGSSVFSGVSAPFNFGAVTDQVSFVAQAIDVGSPVMTREESGALSSVALVGSLPDGTVVGGVIAPAVTGRGVFSDTGDSATVVIDSPMVEPYRIDNAFIPLLDGFVVGLFFDFFLLVLSMIVKPPVRGMQAILRD